jgi:exosortase
MGSKMMPAAAATAPRNTRTFGAVSWRPERLSEAAPAVLTATAFAVLFYYPFTTLVRDWWQSSEAGHGLLLAPVALWLAWKAGRNRAAISQPKLGVAILVGAVLLRYASGLATEFFTLRVSMVAALVGLTVFHAGTRQVMHWWLSFALVFLSIPLPELVTQSLALPLQFKASQMAAAMMEMRHIPVRLSGNVIQLPGHELFVTEACSGLRSLTALISTTILCGALFLRTPVGRIGLLLIAIPVAILVNALRVFLTGFLVFFVSPAFGTGFMHVTEGWLLFLVSLVALGAFTALAAIAERRLREAAPHA